VCICVVLNLYCACTYFTEPCHTLFVSGTYTVLFFDGLVKILKPQCIKVMRPDLKKRVNISS